MEFEWDITKNHKNISKHGISFNQAKTIFNQEAYYFEDTRFTYGEPRYVVIGPLAGTTLIMAVFTLRQQQIRLISARKANKKEQKLYYDEIRKRTDT